MYVCLCVLLGQMWMLYGNKFACKWWTHCIHKWNLHATYTHIYMHTQTHMCVFVSESACAAKSAAGSLLHVSKGFQSGQIWI